MQKIKRIGVVFFLIACILTAFYLDNVNSKTSKEDIQQSKIQREINLKSK